MQEKKLRKVAIVVAIIVGTLGLVTTITNLVDDCNKYEKAGSKCPVWCYTKTETIFNTCKAEPGYACAAWYSQMIDRCSNYIPPIITPDGFTIRDFILGPSK